MLKAIVFDCFGVLYRGSFDYLYEITPRDKHAELRDSTRAMDYGFISENEFLESMAEFSGRPAAEIKALMQQRHVLNQPLVELILELKKTYKIGLLSNIGRGLIDDLFSKTEQAELFDAIVLSSDISAIKPSPAAYYAVAAKLNVDVRDCLMVDDAPRNIEGAEQVDMPGIVFYSTAQFKSGLTALEG